jgi:hypothetical protein
MRPKPLIRPRAQQARSQIDPLLDGTGWYLNVETRVQDAIQLDPGESVPDELAMMFKRGRFDFVIVSTDGDVPRLVIELDGPSHEQPLRVARDVRKDELCIKAALPIVRLAIAHLDTQEQTTALEWIVGEFVRFQREWPALLRELRREHDDETLIDTLARHDWIAYHRHRFPAIDRVAERLARDFSIYEADPPRTIPPDDAPLVVQTYRGQHATLATDVSRRGGGERLYEATQPIPMSPRVADMLSVGLSGPQTGREHIDIVLGFAAFHALGWHRDEIDEQVATWRALRDVELWARHALTGPDGVG